MTAAVIFIVALQRLGGHSGSGHSARWIGPNPIEATRELLGIPHEVIEAVTWDEAARKWLEAVNPPRQVPEGNKSNKGAEQ